MRQNIRPANSRSLQRPTPAHCARRDQDGLAFSKILLVKIVRTVNQEGRVSIFCSQLTKPLTVAAVLAPQHDDHVRLVAEQAYGLLTILGRVTNVFFGRTLYVRETLLADDRMIRFASSTLSVVWVR